MCVVDFPRGVGNESEVGVVGLRLLDELLSFATGDRRKGSISDRCGSFLVSLEHCVNIELGHASTLTPLWERESWAT